MWLITTVGFFSVVRKSGDVRAQTLTVRARVLEDLEALKERYLPELGDIQESASNDYRYRARAPQAAVARAMSQMVDHLDYSNFKDAVAQRQGHARSTLYHDVWASLLALQRPPQHQKTRKATSPTLKLPSPEEPNVHPKPDDKGHTVRIHEPSQPSDPSTWLDPNAQAVAVPGGHVPKVLNGCRMSPWLSAPTTLNGWEQVAKRGQIDEPEFPPPEGLEPAAGVVVLESDGRIWMVKPTNRFGGYELTFPKGRTDGKSLQATAICEAYEEAGLRVKLVAHLVDIPRTQTFTRYYVGQRVGGSPADMGWESQSVMLLPQQHLAGSQLAQVDLQVVRALLNR